MYPESNSPDQLEGVELEFSEGRRRGAIKTFKVIADRLAVSFSRSWTKRDGVWVETHDLFATFPLREERTPDRSVLVPCDEPCSFVIMLVEPVTAPRQEHAAAA